MHLFQIIQKSGEKSELEKMLEGSLIITCNVFILSPGALFKFRTPNQSKNRYFILTCCDKNKGGDWSSNQFSGALYYKRQSRWE